MNKTEAKIGISPTHKVDVADVADRGIPSDGKPQEKIIFEFRVMRSEAEREFIDTMNA